MINKYMMVTIDEDAVGGVEDAMSFLTTKQGSVTINVPSQKLGIKIADLIEATQQLKDFIDGNPITVNKPRPIVETNSEGLIHNIEFTDKD